MTERAKTIAEAATARMTGTKTDGAPTTSTGADMIPLDRALDMVERAVNNATRKASE